mmetsp:Transcript_2990/g.5023  ORF Transcript_2990/g.5023 Transcript_2990/m.5023 type:complete len:162 (+) Transcript_2990:62-547(+)|eukprot:CAMPEP_0169121782 /NCGR_PEP_ID=MMETSP1015-20121227/32858_1 /TAXON_ID=342587 /ORGANISM="Karlodinium micrum, Strain CCMP2283" /LENGTH=161 /DNA_ID=CAMNT_0009184921 /DNA_START=55 /DNA_END=540 /DNA_ORIENTATION=+
METETYQFHNDAEAAATQESLCSLFAALKTNCDDKNEACDDVDMELRSQKKARFLPPPVGLWRSPQGEFRIESAFAGEVVEIKQECKCCGRKLHGILTQVGEWYEAEIREFTAQNSVIGYVRLKLQGNGLRTQCRKSLEENWIAECISERVLEAGTTVVPV